ncbi:MAG: twin-arginine translocase subunit TatC [Verrucomicrobiales bacterium]
MFVLKKLFQARSKVARKRSKWDDVEKPFLDHLEDLRKMLMKVAMTLAITMTLCFVFDKELMELVRYPVKMAGLDSMDGSKLPGEISEADWGKIKDMSRSLATLDEKARESYIAWVPEPLRDATVATHYFRAALTLPQESRAAFVTEVLPAGPRRQLALFLVEKNPEARIDEGGQLLRMTALGPAETFTLSLKLSFFAGIIISFPLLLWFIAEFILPGLTKHERKLVLPSVLVGFILFGIGVCFAYFVVTPKALQFFYEYSLRLGVVSDWRIGYFVSFVTQFTLIFGLCFELPVVVMALVKLGLLSYPTMSRTRSYAIVAIFIISAIITPTTDAITLLLLAGPMVFLYEICIWLAWLIERKERREAEKEDKEWQERRLKPALAVAPAAGAAAAISVDDIPVEDPPPGPEEPWHDPYLAPERESWPDDPERRDHQTFDGQDDEEVETGGPDAGAEDLPVVSPAPGAVARPDFDELPLDWGQPDDPDADRANEGKTGENPGKDEKNLPEA